MSFSKRGTLRILIVGISFLVTLFISEVVARSAPDVFGADRKRLEEFRMFIADGVASFVPRPHTVYGNNPKKSAINSLGYRGEEWSLEKPTPSTLRILCMGGSTTAGMYPTVVERELRKRGIEAEVMNGGVPGWTTAESLVAWFLTFKDYAPDIVVIHHSINDVHPRIHVNYRPDYTHWRHEWRPGMPGFLRRKLIGWSDLVACLSLQQKQFNMMTFTTHQDGQIRSKDDLLPSETAHGYRRNLLSIGRSATELGAKVILMTMPLHSETVYGEYLRAGTFQHNEIMRAIAADEGWFVADAEEDFGQHPVLDEEFRDLCHLSFAGQKAKANVVGRTLYWDLGIGRLADKEADDETGEKAKDG